MSRGGKRQGAGRPKGTGKFREPTKAVRLPISQIDTIMEFIERKYNGGICNKTAENRNVMDFTLTATEREQFQAVGASIRQVCDQLELATKEYENRLVLAGVLQYDRILEIAQLSENSAEQKVEQIAKIMRSFRFRRRLDDLRDEATCLLEHFATFMEIGVFRPSDVRQIQTEFYETLSALMVVDKVWE